MLEKFFRCWKSGEWPGAANNSIGGLIELSERTRERIKRRLEFEKSNAALAGLCASEANIVPWRLELRGQEAGTVSQAVTPQSHGSIPLPCCGGC